VDAASLAPALDAKDAISLFILGTGTSPRLPAPEVRDAFAQAGIALEAMDTGAACRTYNVLLAEGRPIAAALIAVD
jgi:uncharacterized protein